MTTASRRHAGNAGFTLIEVLIAMTVLAIAMVGIYNLFAKNAKAHVSQELTLELTQDLRGALHLMTTEVRMAGYDPEDTAGAGFMTDTDDRYDTDANSIRFTMDINDDTGSGSDDGDVSDTGEDVNYYVATDTDGIQKLYRRLDADDTKVAVVSENITGLTIAYLGSDNTALDPSTMDLSDIRSVTISLTGQASQEDPLLNQVITRTETARIKVRNMGL
jgi:type IV pilus assembly protein PilW